MRAAKSKKEDVTEDQLLKKDVITPQDIVRLDKITESELCYCFVLHNTIGLRLQSAIGNSSRVLHSRDLFLPQTHRHKNGRFSLLFSVSVNLIPLLILPSHC